LEENIMKKINLVFICFAIALATLSCSSDDDGDVLNNSGVLSLGETEIQLRAGVIQDFGSFNDNLYNFDITLISSDINTSQSEPFPSDNVISGIYFELFSTNPDDLAVGDYTQVDFENISNQTFEYAEVFLNLDVSLDEENGEFFELTSGSLTVISNAPVYEIEFSGTDSEGREISGNYSGTLTVIEE